MTNKKGLIIQSHTARLIITFFISLCFTGCFIICHKDFSVKASRFPHTSDKLKSGCYVMYMEDKGWMEIVYLSQNGVAIYGSYNCKKEECDSLVNYFQNKPAKKMSDLESGTYHVAGQTVDMNFITHFHYGNFETTLIKGEIISPVSFTLISKEVPGRYKDTSGTRQFNYNPFIVKDSANWLMKKKWYWK